MESEKQSKRRNIIAFIMAVQVVVTLMFLMFAFSQREEADTQRAMAERTMQAARTAEMESRKLIDSLTIEIEKLKVLVEKK